MAGEALGRLNFTSSYSSKATVDQRLKKLHLTSEDVEFVKLKDKFAFVLGVRLILTQDF